MQFELLGRLVWAIAKRVGKKKASDNQGKLGAAVIVALVLIGGVIAARASGDHD